MHTGVPARAGDGVDRDSRPAATAWSGMACQPFTACQAGRVFFFEKKKQKSFD
jgi:hypothetical protein